MDSSLRNPDINISPYIVQDNISSGKMTEQRQFKEVFDELRQQWRQDTKYLSSASQIVEHPAYQQIIELGEPMLPFILEEVRNERGHWFFALHKITGHVPDNIQNLTFAQIRQAWLDWFKDQNNSGRKYGSNVDLSC